MIRSISTGWKKREVTLMDELKKKFEDNYMTFISVAIGSVALIAAIVWGITVLLKKRNADGCC
jgi:hypothetical protein